MNDKDAAAVTDETGAEDGAGGETVVKIPCMVYSRVVGYLRPLKFWHESKREEFKDRKVFKLPTQT